MADFLKVPKYVDDSPREYTSFTGGINTDPNNENLYDHQLKEALNTHYRNGNLERRLGANVIKKIEYLDFHPDEHEETIQGAFIYTGRMNVYLVVVRDGFIYCGYYRKGLETIKLLQISINVDQYIDLKDYDPENVLIGLHRYTEEERPKFNTKHFGFIYKREEKGIEDIPTLVVNSAEEYPKILVPENNVLVLQNQNKVEAAMFDHKLYIATGTRYIVLEEIQDGDESLIKASIVFPKKINGFEYKNIGTNNLSPFPNQWMESTFGLGTSTIENILIKEQMIFLDDPKINLEAIMNFKSGTTADNYSFKWEYKLPNTDWRVFRGFKDGGSNKILIDFGNKGIDIETQQVLIRCTYSNMFRTEVVETRIKKDLDYSVNLIGGE